MPTRNHPHRPDKPSASPSKIQSSNPHTTSVSALLQRLARTPNVLTATDILQLQKTVGNRAVAYALHQQAVVQRGRTKRTTQSTITTPTRRSKRKDHSVARFNFEEYKASKSSPQGQTKSHRKKAASKAVATAIVRELPGSDEEAKAGKGIQIQFHKEKDTVSSVSFTGKHRPHTRTRKQGDHSTAYVVSEDMIRNNLMGKKFRAATSRILELINQVEAMPGIQDVAADDYARGHLENARLYVIEAKQNDSNSALKAAIGELLAGRNTAKYSSKLNATSTRGHGEAGRAGPLRLADDEIRQGKTISSTTTGLIQCAWELLDYLPTPSIQDEEIVKTLHQHILSLDLGYPRVVPATVTHTALVDYLQRTHHTIVFNKIYNPSRTPTDTRRPADRVRTIITSLRGRV